MWTDNINSINTNPEKWGVFVKPNSIKQIEPYMKKYGYHDG